jgi:hypothetical protein
MINVLRKIFEENPGKSTIELKDECSDCGCEVNIEITSTSGGYGLKSGVLFKSKAVGYFAKCPDCNALNPKLKSSRKKD